MRCMRSTLQAGRTHGPAVFDPSADFDLGEDDDDEDRDDFDDEDDFDEEEDDEDEPPAKKKPANYVSKVWPIAGDTPARVAATFLDSEFSVAKAILREDGRYFMASANGKLPERFELLGIFNCNMPYRDLVRELAA
mgnify:CR=1 FL=1